MTEQETNIENETTEEQVKQNDTSETVEQTAFYSEFGQDGSEEIDPQVRVADLEHEVNDLKDRLLRAVAEAENTRRRAERDRENLRRYASENLSRDLLSVLDNLGRALDAVAHEPAAKDEGPFKTLVDGVNMTERELLNVFERHKIETLNPLGEAFDPNLHQAMFEGPSQEYDSGVVMQVIAKGYQLHDRLLRPAMVGVSKGDV